MPSELDWSPETPRFAFLDLIFCKNPVPSEFDWSKVQKQPLFL
jgi:hypothetical protein